jgi:hypothetical protein
MNDPTWKRSSRVRPTNPSSRCAAGCVAIRPGLERLRGEARRALFQLCELGGELAHAVVAMRGARREGPREHLEQRGPQRRWSLRVQGTLTSNRRRGVGPQLAPMAAAGEQLEQQGADGVDVGARVTCLPAHELGRSVGVTRAQHVDHVSHREVAQLHDLALGRVTALREEDIARAQVAVEHALHQRILERSTNLRSDPERIALGERTARIDGRAQALAHDQIGGEVEHVAVLARCVRGHNAGVLQALALLGREQEAADDIGVGAQRREHDLQRHVTRIFVLLRAKYLGHATVADERRDLEALRDDAADQRMRPARLLVWRRRTAADDHAAPSRMAGD